MSRQIMINERFLTITNCGERCQDIIKANQLLSVKVNHSSEVVHNRIKVWNLRENSHRLSKDPAHGEADMSSLSNVCTSQQCNALSLVRLAWADHLQRAVKDHASHTLSLHIRADMARADGRDDAIYSRQTCLRICVFRDVKAVHIIHAFCTILLDSVKQTCKDVDAEHGNEEQPCNLECRWSKVENSVALCYPAASHQSHCSPRQSKRWTAKFE
jgi:hypothetical protein